MGKFTGHTITSDSALGSAVIERSLRFNDDDSADLSRTPSSASNKKTFTFSFWVKRANLGIVTTIFAIFIDSDNQFTFRFISSDTLQISDYQSASQQLIFTTNAVFRDTSAWYHIVVAVDTTQSTNTDRFKLYVNGSQVTSFSTSTYPSQNHDTIVNTTNAHYIGQKNSTLYFDGYLAEFHFVDGYQYDPSYFGFTDPVTGIWTPKRYEGVYGSNGFYLDFSDNTNTTTLGIDKSPNGNDFTANNFSVSAGVGNDSLEDTPTNNFCTLNKLNTIKYNADYDTIVDQGGLLMRGGDNVSPATMLYPKSGKWYCEFSKYGNGYSQGVSVVRADTDIRNLDGVTSHSSKVTLTTYPELLVRGSNVSNNGTAWDNDADAVIGVAVDMDNGAMYFAINNTWINSGVPTSGSAKTGAVATDLLTVNDGHHYVAAQGFNGNDNAGMYANFGQQAFAYTPPSGYKTLSTKNLPKTVPSIVKPKRHFDVLTWTGNASNGNVITGLEFKPDFIWAKCRSNSHDNQIIDSIRGTTKYASSNRNDTLTASDRITSINNDGFTLGSDGRLNENSATNVAWCWKAGGSSNTFNVDGKGYTTAAAAGITDGSTALTGASVNTEAGFSMITYTGTGSATTVGHGLGAKPDWILFRNRNDEGHGWNVYHSSIGATKNLQLQTNASVATASNKFNNTEPTSTVITVNTAADTNQSGQNMIAYCWTAIPGYSKFGTYTGNGNTNGSYVYLGFRPAFVLFKSTSNSENWQLKDYKRNGYNDQNHTIFANNENVEYTTAEMDFLSNGFKLRNGGGGSNGDGETLVYMAFAEEPGTTPFDTVSNAR